MLTTTDLILSGAYLLPGSKQEELICDAAIAITGDTISAIGSRKDITGNYKAKRTIHTEHGLIMPGLINTHTHAPMALFRGLADDLPLMKWLEDHIFPVEAKLNGETVYHAAMLSMAEMIKSGTTSFCDMYLFSKDVARAAQESGMRAWIGEVLYDFPSPCYGALANGFAYIDDLFSHYRDNALITITAAPHSVYTCSAELLQRLGKVAQDQGCLYVIHLAENSTEVNGCRERFGCTPVQHLDQLGLLRPDTLAAHCVMMDDGEIALMADRGASVSHCAESNMKLASGAAPVSKMLQAGINVGIGTDGAASNNDVDMFLEMDSVAKVQKVVTMDPTAMNAEQTLNAATLGGAATLGADSYTGSLAPGKKADVIVLDMNQPHLVPLYNVPSHLVYAARGSDVIHSVVNGKLLMEGRSLLTIDEDKLLSVIREMAAKLS